MHTCDIDNIGFVHFEARYIYKIKEGISDSFLIRNNKDNDNNNEDNYNEDKDIKDNDNHNKDSNNKDSDNEASNKKDSNNKDNNNKDKNKQKTITKTITTKTETAKVICQVKMFPLFQCILVWFSPFDVHLLNFLVCFTF